MKNAVSSKATFPGAKLAPRDLDELRQTVSLMSGLPVLAPGRTYVLSSLSPQEAPVRRSAYAFFAPGIAAAACAVLLVVIVSGAGCWGAGPVRRR